MNIFVAVVGAALWIGLLWFLFADLLRWRRERHSIDVPIGHVRIGIDDRTGQVATLHVVGPGIVTVEENGPRRVDTPGAE